MNCANPRCKSERPGTARRRSDLGFVLCVDCHALAWMFINTVHRYHRPRPHPKALAQLWFQAQWRKGRRRTALLEAVRHPPKG